MEKEQKLVEGIMWKQDSQSSSCQKYLPIWDWMETRLIFFLRFYSVKMHNDLTCINSQVALFYTLKNTCTLFRKCDFLKIYNDKWNSIIMMKICFSFLVPINLISLLKLYNHHSYIDLLTIVHCHLFHSYIHFIIGFILTIFSGNLSLKIIPFSLSVSSSSINPNQYITIPGPNLFQ